MKTITQKLLDHEAQIDNNLLKGSFIKRHVLYRGFRIAMIPSTAVTCIADLALGIFANLARLSGCRSKALREYANTHVESGLTLPAILCEQVLRFLSPSEGILINQYRVNEAKKCAKNTPDDESYESPLLKENKEPSWAMRNLGQRITAPITTAYYAGCETPHVISGVFHMISSILILGRNADLNKKAVHGLAKIGTLAAQIMEKAVTVARLPL